MDDGFIKFAFYVSWIDIPIGYESGSHFDTSETSHEFDHVER